METPQRYLNLSSGFEDQQSPFPRGQIRGDILSSLHPRSGSQALKSKDNIPQPQWGRRFQWQPSAAPSYQSRLKKLTTGRSSFRLLTVVIWDLLPPSPSEPLLHPLLCESVFLHVGVKYTLLQVKLIPMSCAKASVLPSFYQKHVPVCILAVCSPLPSQCLSHPAHSVIKQTMNKPHKNSLYEPGSKVGNFEWGW